jgi:hypothetical protein
LTLNGDGGNNTLVGSPEADTINGLGGNDILTGGGGNDSIDGGAGIDTAVYSGNHVDYQITYNSAVQAFTVSDHRQGSPDGTDSVTHVEQFQFADGLSIYNFDPSGALISETFNGSNGTHWTNAFDTVGNQTWIWAISEYDTNGALTSQSGLNHDGTHWLALYDVNNLYNWTNVTINFDANWNETSIAGTNDDGSHLVTMQAVAAAFDTATWYSTPFTNVSSAAPAAPSGNTSFSQFQVSVAPSASASPNASPTAGDQFVFAADLGRNSGVDFSQGFATNPNPGPSADHFNQIFEARAAAPTDGNGAFGIHAEAAVDPLALFGLHAAPHAADHFGV